MVTASVMRLYMAEVLFLGQAECWVDREVSVEESISDVIYPTFRLSPT